MGLSVGYLVCPTLEKCVLVFFFFFSFMPILIVFGLVFGNLYFNLVLNLIRENEKCSWWKLEIISSFIRKIITQRHIYGLYWTHSTLKNSSLSSTGVVYLGNWCVFYQMLCHLYSPNSLKSLQKQEIVTRELWDQIFVRHFGWLNGLTPFIKDGQRKDFKTLLAKVWSSQGFFNSVNAILLCSRRAMPYGLTTYMTQKKIWLSKIKLVKLDVLFQAWISLQFVNHLV